MKQITAYLVASSTLIASGYAYATSLNAAPDITKQEISRDVQVTVNLLQPPVPFKAEDKKYLAYEVFLTNFKKTPVELMGLEVQGSKKTTKPLISFDEAALSKMITPIGVTYSPDDSTIILPGMQKILYMWLPIEADATVPKSIKHIFNFQPLNDNAKSVSLEPAPQQVDTTEPVIVGAPLHGDFWVTGNGPSNSSEHRRAYRVGDGKVYISQRFAIDFVQIAGDGLTFKGDKSKNTSYYCYQSDVYSVAQGRVVAVRNDIPENVPNSGVTAVAIDLSTLGGNYVLVNIGNNRYAFYAHLIPGSLKVKPGDFVAKGQVLGKLGNSGNSSEPHLHFHITDSPDLIYANGLTYGFEEFSVRPSQSIAGPTIKINVSDDTLTPYKNQLMLENTVVKFPDTVTTPPPDQADQADQ